METLRTPEELNNPEYNYYLAYSIDPAEKDAKKIETAMATKKCTFTQGTLVQRRLKDLYTETVKIMTDNALREEEFQSAKKIKLETAEKLITAIVKSRGVIYKSDLIKIADASGRWLTTNEIEKKITCLPRQDVKLIDDTKRSLDFLTYDKIERLLKTTGKNDLYDFLEVAQNTPVSTLQSALTTAYNASAKKTDLKSTAAIQLCGEAKKIFTDENLKKSYDVYLATKDIWTEFALRRSCGITEIETKELLHYCETAKKALKTSDVDYIKQLLAEGLNNFRIVVVGGNVTEIEIQNAGGSAVTFIEKCTKSYGIAAQYNGVDRVKNLIFRDSDKPAHAECEYGTFSANQRTISLRVYENDSPEEYVSIDESTQMYESCLINLTPGLPEDAPVNIIFDLDDNGVLTITAVDLTNNIPLTVTPRIGGEAINKRVRLT
jgi:hypothetical protein